MPIDICQRINMEGNIFIFTEEIIEDENEEDGEEKEAEEEEISEEEIQEQGMCFTPMKSLFPNKC